MENDNELLVWAIHNFKAQDSDEYPEFKVGDEIIVVEKDELYNDGWWKGVSKDGIKVGIFPANFVSTTKPAVPKKLRISTDKLPKSTRPSEWDVDDVCLWISSLEGFKQYEENFREHQMDGNALISPFLDVNALKELGIFALERRLFLMNKITELKRTGDFFLTPPTTPREMWNKSPLPPPSPSKSLKSIYGVSSAAIMQKSPHRQKKRSQTVDITPIVPPSIQTLRDVLLLPPDYPVAQVADGIETCDFQGYLHKRGGHAHWSWKRRYFVLKHMSLWYFKSHSPDAKVLGLIILPSYQILPAKTTNVKSGNFTFIAEHPDARTYWFRAESCQEMTEWMNAMVRASLGLPLERSNTMNEPAITTSTTTLSLENANPNKSELLLETKSHHQHGLDASIAVQMEALIKNVKELHSQGLKMPPPIPQKPKFLKPPMSQLEIERRETIMDSVTLKSSMEYVLWINNILFSNDSIIITDDSDENIDVVVEIDIPSPPDRLEPIKHLHLDLTDGRHLIEFLLRLISREIVKECFSHQKQTFSLHKAQISDSINRLFHSYRQLTIPKPHYRVQMIDNLHIVWTIMRKEIHTQSFKHWLGRSSGCQEFETSPLIERLEKLNVCPDGIYQGNLEQILLLMNEIDRVFPMEDD